MKNVIRQGAKCDQVSLPDVGLVLLFKTIHKDGAIILLEENDGARAAGLSFSGACNALLDHPSAEIGVNHALVSEQGGIP